MPRLLRIRNPVNIHNSTPPDPIMSQLDPFFITFIQESIHFYFCMKPGRFIFPLVIHFYYKETCGPGSSVAIATELRAGRSGIESRWGRDFPPVQTCPGAHQASCKMGPGGKVRPGRAADHSPPSSVAVMEE